MRQRLTNGEEPDTTTETVEDEINNDIEPREVTPADQSETSPPENKEKSGIDSTELYGGHFGHFRILHI